MLKLGNKVVYNLSAIPKADLEEMQGQLKKLSKQKLFSLILYEFRARIDQTIGGNSPSEKKIGAVEQLLQLSDLFQSTLDKSIIQEIQRRSASDPDTPDLAKEYEKKEKADSFKQKVLKSIS